MCAIHHSYWPQRNHAILERRFGVAAALEKKFASASHVLGQNESGSFRLYKE
jgi:hypothetical protein